MIVRVSTLDRVPKQFLLRWNNGLVFTSRSFTTLARSNEARQGFITPLSTEQDGLAGRVIRTLKKQFMHRLRFESLHTSRLIDDWPHFYSYGRSHRMLGENSR